jgi:four helix bundle protein
MKTFRTLELAIDFHKALEKLIITGHMKDQLFRAATSIPLNLAEGNAKQSVKEKKRYYQTAYGSVQECKTILKLIECKDENLVDTADKLGAWIFKLLNSEITVFKFRDTGKPVNR